MTTSPTSCATIGTPKACTAARRSAPGDADRLKHDERRLARDRAHASAAGARAHEAGRRA